MTRALQAASATILLCCAAGCLDAAPTYAPREQIPPFVLASRVTPPLGAVYEGPIPFSINVPFQSEDVTSNLEARLYRDLVPGTARGFAAQTAVIAAGVYEDSDRSVTMEWSEQLTGCHSLTLILTYANNYDDPAPSLEGEGPSTSGLPLDDSRAARVVWWINIGDVNDDVLIDSCPRANQEDPETREAAE